MKTFKQFFKNTETLVGIATAISFLLIFFCIWMTAYSGVSDRVEKLRIGVVNEDGLIGSKIEKELKKSVPFEIKPYQSITKAKKAMNKRNLDMVIFIPANFSNQLQGEGKTKITYFINQANASMAKQIMDSAAQNITQSVNSNVYAFKQQLILSTMPGQISKVIPDQKTAQNISGDISKVILNLSNQLVDPSVVKTNNTSGFSATMVPMMIVLASFVGSMIMSLNLNTVSIRLKNHFNKWSIFLTRQIINFGSSILLAIITLLFLAIFNIEMTTTLFETGIFQFLVYFSFLSLTQMFIILFGPGGMIFNIIFLSLQLVTSGVIVPKEMLSGFYHAVSFYLPATYVADGYYTVIFGGDTLANNMLTLFIITTIVLFIAFVRVSFQDNPGLLKGKSPTQENVLS
ncbi:ABC transporter permease [Bacillus sp. MCCB 382]|uniref:YhgE/Pip domain-containing protein n=1 Tax=Bacillus sp. MCCB 382 TaxID=2860197 RepID=UPI001C577DA1|nr:ABC transporter permease [Bacillus sp. MCCB 382]